MPSSLQSLFFVAAVAFGTAGILTPLVARVAISRGWVDRPDRRRKLHSRPIPGVGGVAVFLGFVGGLILLELVEDPPWTHGAGLLPSWVPVALAAFALTLVGLVDDVRGVRPRTKLAVQVAAAVFLFAVGFRIQVLSNPFGPAFDLGSWALPVTVLWLVGMSNAFNLIDGMDGLAAGLALVATSGLLVAAVLSDRLEAVVVATALAGALAGFLPYNFNPARVFLGDCGALPVGFILAAVAIQGSMKSSAAIAVAVPLLAMALPILDVGLAVVRRFVRRQPLFEGDRDHIHHRLVDLGLTPRRAVVTLYLVAALFTALALATTMGSKSILWAVLLVVALVVAVGVRALGYWEVTEIQKSFLSRLAAGLRPSGDAALKGLQHDLAEDDDVAGAWQRLYTAAWTLDLEELHFVPKESHAEVLPELHTFAPRERADDGVGPVRDALWSFEVTVEGEVVAEMTAHRPLGPLDFDPMGLVTLVEELTARHLARVRREAAAEVTARAAPEASPPAPSEAEMDGAVP